METVASAMISRPKVCGPGLTVSAARELFADDHVHALLLVDGADGADGADGPALLAVVERADLHDARPDAPARGYGRLAGRVVGPGEDVDAVRRTLGERRRRVAVVDADGTLLGLLCLKRSGRGFCTDDDVAARAAELGRAVPPRVAGHALLP